MINYETILSNYEDKLTLMQWLDKVDKALHDATATGFHVNKTGTSTLTFSIDFDDGTTLTSEPVVVNQGESVASAAVNNGVLTLTLTNGQVLNAGNIFNGNLTLNGDLSVSGALSAASVTASGNTTINGDLSVSGETTLNDDLICTYIDVSGDIDCGDDLMVAGDATIVGNATASTFTAPSVIATGTGLKTDVISNINGDIDVFANEVDFNGKIQAQGDIETFGDIKTDYLNSDSAEISAKKPVVEVMTGYSFTKNTETGVTLNFTYAGVVKNGNKITFCYAVEITRTGTAPTAASVGVFYIPSSIGDKLFPAFSNILSADNIEGRTDSLSEIKQIPSATIKSSNTQIYVNLYGVNSILTENVTYYFRYEKTFLLSENLAA